MPRGPLSGVRVVELAGMGPGPFAAMMLAELGADVIRIDRPHAVALGPDPDDDLLNRGRPTIVVDLKHPAGAEVVRRLVDSADVLIEGFRPGVTERLGLGPDELLARRPALVYARMTGWGQTGPLAPRAGHDITYIALTGALHAIGPANASAVPLNVVGDFGGGALYLVVGILAALHEVAASGRGQVVDAAIVDGTAHLLTSVHGLLAAGLWTDQRESNSLDGGMPYYAVYACSDGRQLAVGALEPQFYAEFERLLGLDRPLPDRDDRAQWPALREALADAIGSRSQADWVAVFEGSDACVAPVMSLTEAADHPHLKARGTLSHSGRGPVASPAPRFSRTPTSHVAAARRSEPDTRGTLQRWGVDDADELIAAGAVFRSSDE